MAFSSVLRFHTKNLMLLVLVGLDFYAENINNNGKIVCYFSGVTAKIENYSRFFGYSQKTL